MIIDNYFYKPVELRYRKEFYTTTRINNIRNGYIFTLVVSLVVFFLLLLSQLINLPAFIPNHDKFKTMDSLLLFVSLVFMLLFFIISHNQQWVKYYPFIVPVYLCIFISVCTLSVFIVNNNPKNTMSMIILGMLSVAAVFIFSFWETLIIVAWTSIIFTFGLIYTDTPVVLWVGNYFVFYFLMAAFFAISRIVYSYEANQFIKLKLIEQKNKEIVTANKLKTEILGVVAHDLRNPLSSIQGLVTLLQEHKTQDEIEKRYIEYIKQSCDVANTIINDLLEAAKRNEAPELSSFTIDLNLLMKNSYNEWSWVYRNEKKFKLQLPVKNLSIKGDTQKFKRVIDNIVNNAVKFTHEQGTISLSLKQDKKNAIISIKDNGIGIPDDLMPNLFDRFTSSGRKGVNQQESNGLGLNISKQIIEQHGGKISVQSKVNSGTIFTITLPLAYD